MLLLVHPLAVIALGVRPAVRTWFLFTFLAVVSQRLVPPAGIRLHSPIASGAQADPFCVSAAGAFPHCELPAELLFPSAFHVRVQPQKPNWNAQACVSTVFEGGR